MRHVGARLPAVLAPLVLLAAGCGSEAPAPPLPPGGPPTVAALWVVAPTLDELTGERFFDHPWPSDLRRAPDGTIRVAGYPNPRGKPVLDDYVADIEGELDGFSPAAAGYLRFDGAIDPATLPATPLAATKPTSSVQLLDIDPASPERGSRRLLTLRWQKDPGVYWLPNTLAFLPTLGFPLRPSTRYALVVTDALRAAGGGKVIPSAHLREALGFAEGGPETDAAREALAPALSALEAEGIAAERIVHLAVFTTTDPTAELARVRDRMVLDVPAPAFRAEAWSVVEQHADRVEYAGTYGPSPIYQHGKVPYASHGDGGGFAFNGAGVPEVAELVDLRFSLTVPDAAACPPPPNGYPIVLYAHGTGGDYRSYTRDGTAEALAARCLATMGIDQPFHGERPGSGSGDVALLTFNVNNAVAARTNFRQAALEEVQRARLFTAAGAVVPAQVSTTGMEIGFDPFRVLFFGHSQGGLNGPLFLAVDDAARGGVLSGSSASMSITLLEKTNPVNVTGLFLTFLLGLTANEHAEVDALHPGVSLAQMIVDVVDPLHYARLLVREPRGGSGPRSLYLTEGIAPDGTGDSYSPAHGIEVHALAAGLPLQLPLVRPIAESAWGGPPPVEIPPDGLEGNLAGGAASGVLAQWSPPPGADGHFVVFDVPAATSQASGFLRHLADLPAGKVPPP